MLKKPILAVILLILASCDTVPMMATTAPRMLVNTPNIQQIRVPDSASIQRPNQRPQPHSAAEVAYIKAVLNDLQVRSIAENREFCGYVGLNAAGQFAISGPTRGNPASCQLQPPPRNLRLLASYHTHAAYNPRYDNEVPSVNDLEGDISERLDGYVSTPGGRLWYNNASTGQASLICDRACLVVDPGFVPDYQHPVAQRYSLAALRARQG